ARVAVDRDGAGQRLGDDVDDVVARTQVDDQQVLRVRHEEQGPESLPTHGQAVHRSLLFHPLLAVGRSAADCALLDRGRPWLGSDVARGWIEEAISLDKLRVDVDKHGLNAGAAQIAESDRISPLSTVQV